MCPVPVATPIATPTFPSLPPYVSGVPLTTLYHHRRRRQSKEAKAQSQQYLTPPEEKALTNFRTHKTLKALEFCFKNNIILCRLPSHTSHKLQPCDVSVFTRLKDEYHDKAKKLFQRGANTIDKQHFTSLYSHARDKAFTKRNILAGWAACGLFPFNPERVLKKTPKPPTQSTVPTADETGVVSSHQDKVPQTPVTPVSAEGLASLHNLIKEDILTLDEASIQRVERHVQKLVHAAQVSFAEVRRSTRSVVLRKAKVISYKDIEEARKKRTAKDATKGKGKRGRKRKSAALEADEPEADEEEPEVAHTAEKVITGKRNRGRKHKSAVQETDGPEPEPEPEPEQEMAQMIEESEEEVAQTSKAPEPWRAPVAHRGRFLEAGLAQASQLTTGLKSRQRQRKLPLPATWTTVTPFSYTFLAMTDDPLRVIIRACVTDIPGNKFARSTRLAQDFSEQVRKRPFNNNLKAECHDSEHILPRFDSDDAVRAWFIIDFNVTRSLIFLPKDRFRLRVKTSRQAGRALRPSSTS
ncbi:hypothetical protein B7494_g1667 [Chlorociboria aeruginascens]|nr:hypothetical protein B7494_g1667 [Chlorociboria aeruginascens]